MASSPLPPQHAHSKQSRYKLSNCMEWTRSANPITTCLLLYIAVFQWTSSYHAAVTSANGEEPDETATVGRLMEDFTNSRKASVMSKETIPRGKLYSHLTDDRVVLPIKPWQPYTADIASIKVPFPIFQTSISKSGTTSLFKYLRCGGLKSSHQYVSKAPGERASLTGECVEQNIKHDAPPFEDCGEYDVFTDTGYLKYDHDSGEQCFYPSIDGLDRIYAHYPNSTFVNIIRETQAWYESLKGWSKASLFVRMRLCNATHFPNGQSNRQGWYDFYTWHNDMVRQFARDHPSLTYIEVKLEDENLGNIMEEKFGIGAECWKNCRPQNNLCDEDMEKGED